MQNDVKQVYSRGRAGVPDSKYVKFTKDTDDVFIDGDFIGKENWEGAQNFPHFL